MGSFSLRLRILIETVALIATVASGTLLFGAIGTIAAGILATIIVLFRSLGLTRQFSDLTEDVCMNKGTIDSVCFNRPLN